MAEKKALTARNQGNRIQRILLIAETKYKPFDLFSFVKNNSQMFYLSGLEEPLTIKVDCNITVSAG